MSPADWPPAGDVGRPAPGPRLARAASALYAGLLLLIAFNLVFTPRFAEIATSVLQFVQVVPVAIIALGMALVIGTRGIDLSVGSVDGDRRRRSAR